MATAPTAIDLALALAREGRLVDAEQLLHRELQATEERCGRGSPQWASVHCDLGNLLYGTGQAHRAIEHFRAACSIPVPQDPETHKDLITYRLNLAMALAAAGRPAEAEAELRHNLQERLSFYGREHPGYAFGLETLAELLLDRGDLAAAREAIEETVANFWNNGHERVATALALRARIIQASGGHEPLFHCLDRLPDEIVSSTAHAVIRASGGHPELDKAILARLAEAVEARLGPDHETTLAVLSRLANISHHTGDEPGRVAAIQRVLASYLRQGRTEEAIHALQGLAMAQSDAGDWAASLGSYAQAHAHAQSLGRPDLAAQVLRNWGIALSTAGQTAEAERRLREAVAVAETGHDPELLGRTRIALGLFLQHTQRLAEARQVVEAGLATLDPAHPDAIMGRGHLTAMLENRSCGCGNTPDAVAAAFREFVLARLPQDLLSRLDVEIKDNDLSVNVALNREPTPAELDHLNNLIQSATAEFRRRLRLYT